MILALSTGVTVLFSIIVFLIIILILVSTLLYARHKLIPHGKVSLKINERDVKVSPGSNLLTTLSSNGIFLPSACGGGGTCGLCKCQIYEGGGLYFLLRKAFLHERNSRMTGVWGARLRSGKTLK